MSQIVADALLLLVTVIWGTTFVVVKGTISDIKPFTFLAVRFFIGGLFLLLVLGVKNIVRDNKKTLFRPVRTQDKGVSGDHSEGEDSVQVRELLKGSVVTGVTLFFSYATQTFGLLTVPAGKAAFITGLSVVIVPLASAILLKRVPERNAILGVVLAACGLGLMSLTLPIDIQHGDTLVFLCAIGFATHILLIEKYSKSIDPLIFATIQLFVVSLGSFIAAFLLERPLTIPNNTWGAISYTGIMATSLTILIQSGVQKYTSATHAALILSAEPVFGAFFAWITIGEVLSTREMFGAILILAGMLISEIDSLGSSGKKDV